MVIFEPEALFHKGEILVRRGQAAAAEPLLRQAASCDVTTSRLIVGACARQVF